MIDTLKLQRPFVASDIHKTLVTAVLNSAIGALVNLVADGFGFVSAGVLTPERLTIAPAALAKRCGTWVVTELRVSGEPPSALGLPVSAFQTYDDGLMHGGGRAVRVLVLVLHIFGLVL